MKIVVSKAEIQEKLSNIQNIVDRKNTMPILSHFLLNAGKNGSFITATDLETAIKEPLQITVDKEGSICVPAKKMFEIVREIDGDLFCESVDEQWLKIKAGASNFRLACLSSKEFPVWPAMEDLDEISIESEVLSEIIEKTVYAAGESDTRYTLNGLLFHTVQDRLTTVGTDGHRLAMTVRNVESTIREERKIIVPRKSAIELRKILEKANGKVKITFGSNHVLFSIGDIKFLTRLIEGTYPNYEQVIPRANERKINMNKDMFAKVLRRVSIMSKERSNAIKFDLEKDQIIVTSSNPDMGEARDEMPVEYSGDAITTGFNARYLLDILNSMSSEKITMEMQAPLSPVLVREEQKEDYLCVIMPIRI